MDTLVYQTYSYSGKPQAPKTIQVPAGILWYKDNICCHGMYNGAYNYTAIIPHNDENKEWISTLEHSIYNDIEFIDFHDFYFIFMESVLILSEVEYTDKLVFPDTSILLFNKSLDEYYYAFESYIRPIEFVGGGQITCEICSDNSLIVGSKFARASHEIGTTVIYNFNSQWVHNSHIVIGSHIASYYKKAIIELIEQGYTGYDIRYGHTLWARLQQDKKYIFDDDSITMERPDRKRYEDDFIRFLDGKIIGYK